MKYVYIKIMESLDQAIVRRVTGTLAVLLNREVKVIQKCEIPQYAFVPERDQYYAREIIERLLCELPGDCDKLIGVTAVDLCTPILTFVYGEAQMGGRVAVVSTHRLRQEYYRLPQNDEVFFQRLLTECLHELGHCYGLIHCNDFRCAMFFSNTILNVDEKEGKFCVKCQEYFGKMPKEAHEQEQDTGR